VSGAETLTETERDWLAKPDMLQSWGVEEKALRIIDAANARIAELEAKLASYVREHTAIVQAHLQSGNDNAELRARIAELESLLAELGDYENIAGRLQASLDAANARIAELEELEAACAHADEELAAAAEALRECGHALKAAMLIAEIQKITPTDQAVLDAAEAFFDARDVVGDERAFEKLMEAVHARREAVP